MFKRSLELFACHLRKWFNSLFEVYWCLWPCNRSREGQKGLFSCSSVCLVWSTFSLCNCVWFYECALAAKCFSRQTFLSLWGLFQITFQTITILIFFIFLPSWQTQWFHTHSYRLWKSYFERDRFKVKSETRGALLFLNMTRFSAVSSNLNQIYIFYRPKCNEEMTMVTWNIA